jgi:hypothetical protein
LEVNNASINPPINDLSSSARKKVTAGSELSVADATVAEVNLRLAWYRFMLNVILRTRKI